MKQDVATLSVMGNGGNSCGVCLGLDRAISLIKAHLSRIQKKYCNLDLYMVLKETPGCV